MSKTFLNLTNNWLLPSQNALSDCHQNLHWRLLRGYIPLLPCHLSILDKEFHLCAVHIHDFSHLRDTRLFFNFYCATLLYSICQGAWGVNPPTGWWWPQHTWLKILVWRSKRRSALTLRFRSSNTNITSRWHRGTFHSHFERPSSLLHFFPRNEAVVCLIRDSSCFVLFPVYVLKTRSDYRCMLGTLSQCCSQAKL